MARFLLVMVVLAVSAPAPACLNDTEVPRQDEQFRSSYSDGVAAPPAAPGDSLWMRPSVLIAVGSALALGAAIGVRVRRRQ